MTGGDDLASSVRAALERIEAVWLRMGAPIVDALRPGLADEQIDQILRPTGLLLPVEVRELFRWHDGTHNTQIGAADDRAYFGFGWDFADLGTLIEFYQGKWRESLVTFAAMANEPVMWWPEWFPVFLSEQSAAVVSTADRPVWHPIAVVQPIMPFEENWQHPSFVSLVETWASLLETGAEVWGQQEWHRTIHLRTYRAALGP